MDQDLGSRPSATNDSEITIWNLKSGSVSHVLRKYSGIVMSIDFSPDGRRVVSAGSDGTIQLWDVSTGAELLELTDTGISLPNQRDHADSTHEERRKFTRVSFSHDGNRIAAVHPQGMTVWNVEIQSAVAR